MNWSTFQKNILRKWLKRTLQTKALVQGKSFYCAALQGESDYNICVHSDMTMSCNSQDYDGSGKIGDLNTSTLSEIFGSEKVVTMRRSLANGVLPIDTCARCRELRMVSKNAANDLVSKYRVPTRGIKVENTANCNLSCTACDRSLVRQTHKKMSLTLSEIEKVSMELKKNKLESLSYFCLGEPFLSNVIADELAIIRKNNPDIFVILSTNGTFVNGSKKMEAIKNINFLMFSIDGVDNESLTKYQKGGNFKLAYKNMCEAVKYRNEKRWLSSKIEWKYVVFGWNDSKKQIARAIELAKLAGVDSLFFFPSTNPFWGISWRYFMSNGISGMGVAEDGGRRLYLKRIE